MTNKELNILKKGCEIIKGFEGLKLTSYKDQGGIWTIGYGSTGRDIKEGLHWTQEEAEERLESDAYIFYMHMKPMIHVELTENQSIALLSLAYNIGLEAFRTSTLLRKINNYEDGVADQFIRWNKVNGRADAGLSKRRIAERDLFLTA